MEYNGVVNIFTDASVLGKIDTVNKNRVCAGAIAVVNGRRDREYHSIFEKSTNNYGELSALFLGIQLASQYVKPDRINNINIFSDSMISVKAVKSWIYGWFDTMSYDGTIYSSNGGPVANQNIIKSIYDYVINYFDPTIVNLKIHHVKGHVDVRSGDSLRKARACLRNNYKYIQDFPLDVIIDIQRWNNYIDESTRSSLTRPQYGVEYKGDLAKLQPAIIDTEYLQMVYSDIIKEKF